MRKKLKVGSKVRIPRAPEYDYQGEKWIIFEEMDNRLHLVRRTRKDARKVTWTGDRYARVDKYTPKFIFATVAH